MNHQNNTRYQLFSQGIFIDPMVEVAKLKSLAEQLKPLRTNKELIRIGVNTDGGYLVPNDLEGIKACFSPGVDDIASFEQDLLTKGIGSHLADYSVDEIPNNTPALSFIKKFLGANTYDHFISLEDWVENYAPNSQDDSLILQMDIEGAEYETLLSCSNEILNKFRIMVIEFHNTESWGQSDFFNIVNSVFKKLLKTHLIVHSHPNNAMGLVNMNGFLAPRVFELTFIKKNRVIHDGFAKIPNELDFPNVNYMPDLHMPIEWGGDVGSSKTTYLSSVEKGGL